MRERETAADDENQYMHKLETRQIILDDILTDTERQRSEEFLHYLVEAKRKSAPENSVGEIIRLSEQSNT